MLVLRQTPSLTTRVRSLVFMLVTMGMVLCLTLPAWAGTTQLVLDDIQESFSDGKVVWIDDGAYGAKKKAIKKQIGKYPKLDMRVVVLGPDNEKANLETIATRLRRAFNGTVIVFSPSSLYLSSDVVSQATITSTIQVLSDQMGNETNVAVAVGLLADELSHGKRATKAIEASESNSEGGSQAGIWIMGMVVAAGIVVLIMRFSSKHSDMNSKAVQSEEEMAEENEHIDQLIQDATVLRDNIGTLIIDINEKMLFNTDKNIEKDFGRYLTQYKRYSSAIDSIVSIPTGEATVANLERVRDGLQTIMAELL